MERYKKFDSANYSKQLSILIEKISFKHEPSLIKQLIELETDDKLKLLMLLENNFVLESYRIYKIIKNKSFKNDILPLIKYKASRFGIKELF